MGNAYKHLVFDCDGVLWQGTNDGYFVCYHRAATEAGIGLDFDLARERILKNWGKSARMEVEGMIPEYPDRVNDVVARYRKLVRSDLFLSTASLVPGTGETLKVLSRKFGLSAITGMNFANLTRLLSRFELRQHFKHAISTSETDDPAQQKATGYHLRQLMEQEGLGSGDVLVVGDALSDVQMARSQGVDIVAVLTGHLTEEEARRLGVTKTLPDVTALTEWLARLP